MKNKEIEELLNELKDEDNYIEEYGFRYKRIALDDWWLLLSYIEQLEKENETLGEIVNIKDEQLKEMQMQKTDYTAVNILEAKIEQLENKYNKALEILSDYNMPCEYVKPIIPDEYCEENCKVSDEVYKKCWNKHIELTLKGDSDE